MEYYMGIDMGTSSVKLALTDKYGVILQQVNKSYQIEQPKPGFKEIHPDVWFMAVKEGIKELLSQKYQGQVKAIGVTGQMHTLVCINKEGRPIRKAIMWNDTRTKDRISFLKEQIAAKKEMSYIANIISTGSPAANLFWLKENEPEHFEQIEKFLIGPDYIVYCLTGVFGTDYCEASTSSLMDLQKKEWSKAMQDIIGLPKKVYPVIRGSGEIVATLKKEVARELNMDTCVCVIAGTGDNPAASITTGCLEYGYPVLSLGTSGVLMTVKKQMDFTAKGKNILFSIDNKTFFHMAQGVVQSAGSSYSWFLNDILQTKDFDVPLDSVELSNLKEKEILFYPHLVGEKTIYSNPCLRGAFLGLSTDTSRQDMILSVMEGIAFGVRQLTEEMNFTKTSLQDLKVTGGGAKSEIWMQILADVLDTTVQQLDGNIGAAYSMALLAGYACGSICSLKELTQISVQTKKMFAPRPDYAAAYYEKYKKYKKIYQAMKTIFE